MKRHFFTAIKLNISHLDLYLLVEQSDHVLCLVERGLGLVVDPGLEGALGVVLEARQAFLKRV